MVRKEYTPLEQMQIAIMRDIFEHLEFPEHIHTLIDNLVLNKQQKELLQKKYCEKVGNKNIAYKFQVSERWLSSLLNEALLASYNSLKYNLRNGSVVPKQR